MKNLEKEWKTKHIGLCGSIKNKYSSAQIDFSFFMKNILEHPSCQICIFYLEYSKTNKYKGRRRYEMHDNTPV